MIRTTFLRPFLTLSLLVAASFVTLNAYAVVGDIYETNEGNILRFRTTGGTPGTFATGLGNPKGLVFDGKGRLYVADASRGLIVFYNTVDGSTGTFATGLSSPVGLTFDAAGNLYEADSGSGKIHKFSIGDATKTVFATGLGGPGGLAFDSGGNLFVADFTGGKIYQVNPAGTVSTFATGLNLPAGLAVDSSNNLFVADSGSGIIYKFTPNGTRSSFATGFGRPYGLAFEAAGTLIVADNETGETVRVSTDGVKKVIFGSDFNTPQFVAIEPAAHQLLNLSTRGIVQTGDNVLFVGFIISGNGPVGTNVIVRALGPSLTAAGVPNALQDPVLELRDAFGNLLATNDNWEDSQKDIITSKGLPLPNPKESGIYISLPGGSFTAIVRGAGNSTGTAVLEVYNLQ